MASVKVKSESESSSVISPLGSKITSGGSKSGGVTDVTGGVGVTDVSDGVSISAESRVAVEVGWTKSGVGGVVTTVTHITDTADGVTGVTYETAVTDGAAGVLSIPTILAEES